MKLDTNEKIHCLKNFTYEAFKHSFMLCWFLVQKQYYFLAEEQLNKL